MAAGLDVSSGARNVGELTGGAHLEVCDQAASISDSFKVCHGQNRHSFLGLKLLCEVRRY